MTRAYATGRQDSDALIPADANRRMFDGIAPRYDMMNRLISLGLDRRWRRTALEALAPEQGKRYLDLGCGTGDMAFAIMRRTPNAIVIGVDPAERMLEIARRRMSAAPPANISFRAGDAASLDLQNSTLSGVVTAFCVRNLTNRRLAWAEILRVLEPDGRLVILELTRPGNPVLRALHRVYTRLFVPALGRLVASGQAYRYLVDSVEQFASPVDIGSELLAAGFTSVDARPLTGGIVTLFTARKPRTQEPRSGGMP